MFVKRFSLGRAFGVWLVVTMLGLVGLLQILRPFRIWLSDRYVARGDTYLVAQDFGKARQEYEKALLHNKGNALAAEHRRLADIGPSDIAQLDGFYRERGVKAVTEQLDEAYGPFATPKAALAVGYTLFQKGEFVYAQYPMQRAVQMDPEYPEAWHYLALTYRELAKVDPSFNAKADEAIAKRNILTPKYILEEQSQNVQ